MSDYTSARILSAFSRSELHALRQEYIDLAIGAEPMPSYLTTDRCWRAVDEINAELDRRSHAGITY